MRLFGAKYRGESTGEHTRIIRYSTAVPVTASEVRDYLGYGSSSQDTLIAKMIDAAISAIEKYKGISIVNKTLSTTWDTFSESEELPYNPVNKVESVVRSYNGTNTTLTTEYNVTGGRNKSVNVSSVFSTSGYYAYGLKVVYQAGILIPVTLNADTDTFTLEEHPLSDGDIVNVSTYGTLAAGLTEGKTYYVVNKADDTFQVSESLDGAAVDLTDTGTGQQYIGKLDEDLRQLIIKQAAVFFNRGESSEGLTNEVKSGLRREVW